MKQKLFLGITFVLCWGIEIGLILTGHVSDRIYDLMMPLVMLAPALAVLITKFTVKEPLGMNLWFKPQRRKTFLYILAGWIGVALLIALGTTLYFLVDKHMFDPKMTAALSELKNDSGIAEQVAKYSDGEIRTMLIQQIVINVIFAPVANLLIRLPEEFAWRGYYLNMLCEKHPRWRAVLINGIVWGIWYLPLVVGMGMYYGKGTVVHLVIACICTVLYSVVMSVLYSFLTIKTQTCLPAYFASAVVASMATAGVFFTKDPQKINPFFSYYPNAMPGGIGFLIVAVIILYFLLKDKIQPAPAKEKVLPQASPGKDESPGEAKSLRSHLQNPNLPKKH